MRTIIIMCLLVALSFATTPFSDVPQAHWAYQAVVDLTEKGIIDGYPNGTFQGSKTVTRYEMAMVVGRLMANEAKATPADAATIKKLSVEFATELKNMGVKVAALEKDMKDVKGQVANLKNQRAPLAMNSRLQITGDVQVRYDDRNWETTAVNAACNDNQFMDLLGLNVNINVDPSISAFLRFERSGFWNTSAGDWTVAKATGVHVDTDLRSSLAYIDIKDFFGWGDLLRLGRQRYALSHNLVIKGVADGIYVDHSFGKVKGAFGLIKFDDSAANGSTNDNEGIDTWYTDWAFKALNINFDVYYLDKTNQYAPTGNAAAAHANIMDGDAGRYHYLGIGASHNFTDKFQVYGEATGLKTDNAIKIGADLADSANAYLAGLNWKVLRDLSVSAQYTRFGENFISTGIFDVDTYLDPEEDFLFNAAGYRSDFADTMLQAKYQVNNKFSLLGRAELIQDNRNLVAGVPNDDRSIYTGIAKYQYQPNTALSFTYRKVNTESNNGATPVSRTASGFNGLGNAGGANTGAANEVNVDDVTLYRLQLDIKF